MVGKSTCGRGETGRSRKAMPPASAIATVSSEVATGRRMKGSDRLIAVALRRLRQRLVPGRATGAPALEPRDEAGELEVDHRRRVQGEELAHEQSADDGDAQRPPQLAAGARAER